VSIRTAPGVIWFRLVPLAAVAAAAFFMEARMVIVPDKCIYVFTPRTGSRATEQALLEIDGAYMLNPRVHHDEPSTIPDMGLPVYATIRHPYTQCLSWFAPWQRMHTIETFVHRAPPGRHWLKKRLNVYDEWVDGYFVFEEGLGKIMEKLGHPEIEVPELGKSSFDKDYLTDSAKKAIETVFPFDMELYRRVTAGERLM